MNTNDCITSRRSVRKFQSQPISREDFEAIVQLASYSPSWNNTQITRYTLVQDRSLLHRMATDAVMGFKGNENILLNAPSAVVVTMVKGKSGFNPDGSPSTSKGDRWEMFDAGVATQTFCLAAHEKGYGTVILGIFDDAKVHKIIGASEDEVVATVIPIGLPDGDATMPKRKQVTELVSFR